MLAVVTGMIATYPVGGVFWDYVQYALALERLGWEVWYLEDCDMPCYDLDARDYDYSGDSAPHVAYLEKVLGSVSPTLAARWHFRADDGRCFGLPRRELADLVAAADLFLNVSGVAVLRDEYVRCRRKVYVDTDPGWNHYMRFPRHDADPVAGDHGYRGHDHHFTYAERLGRPRCLLPDYGLRWHPTRPPVLVDLWDGAPAPERDAPFTTVLSWQNAPRPIVHEGVEYGTKEREFARFEDVPGQVDVRLEVAAGGAHPPVERWHRRGWSVVDSTSVSRTPDDYRDYIQRSRGEFSVAKHVYVATGSGWFSCRSLCYLAAGRPVVLQDTGFADVLPTGEGVVPFRTPPEAARALRAVDRDYQHHAAAARQVAGEHFDGERVVAELLDRVGVNG